MYQLGNTHCVGCSVCQILYTRINVDPQVSQYQQHWWKCNGPCQKWPPYFGMVKRAMNRAPAPRDIWWDEHKRKCGGNYVKIKEPHGYRKKTSKRKQGSDGGNQDLGKIIQSVNDSGEFSGTNEPNEVKSSEPATSLTAFTGHGFVLSTDSQKQEDKDCIRNKMLKAAEKRKMESELTASSFSRGVKRKKSSSISQEGSGATGNPKKSCLQSKDANYILIDQESSNIDKEDIPVINIPDVDLSKKSGSTSPDDFVHDFKTCPLCGMSNIPSAIINIHVSLCLEAEDQLQHVDDDEEDL